MSAMPTPRSGRRRINPNNYFEAGEVSILRTYFEMKLRKADPPLDSLLVDESDNYYAVRLWNSVEDRGSVTAISNAVARICLADCQDRLPQWAAVDAQGGEVLGRRVRGGRRSVGCVSGARMARGARSSAFETGCPWGR